MELSGTTDEKWNEVISSHSKDIKIERYKRCTEKTYIDEDCRFGHTEEETAE